MTSLSHLAGPALAPVHDRSYTQSRRAELFLGLWCGFLFFYGLGAGQLYRTENLRAIVAQGMLNSGDWIVPRLYGEPLLTKPPGMYLAIALCSLPFGHVTELSARLPSALAAALTVLLFYDLFRRFLGRRGALIAAGILPLSLIYLDKSAAAEIDMLLVASVVGAVYCFLRMLLALDVQRPTFRWWLGVEFCLAAGVLTKWTAPMFFYCMAVPLLWQRGRLRLLWSRQHLLSAAMGAGLCLAWVGAAVATVGWDSFSGTILREAFPRLLPFYDRQYHLHHSYWVEALRHPLWVLATGLPVSLLLPFTSRRGFFQLWDERGRLLLLAMHCWVWPNLLFWTLISDHKPRHSFALMPGAAGLAAFVILAWQTGRLPLPWKKISLRQTICAALIFWFVVKVMYVEVILPRRSAHAAPRDKGLLLASLVPFSAILYVLRLKDEGIMFYFGREVVRLQSLKELPSASEPMYCILDEFEWREARQRRSVEVVQHLNDEQGDPIVLVKVH